MLEFIVKYYFIFLIAAIVLLLGLFGYMMDKKRYQKYHKEFEEEYGTTSLLENEDGSQNIATPILVKKEEIQNNKAPEIKVTPIKEETKEADPLTGTPNE